MRSVEKQSRADPSDLYNTERTQKARYMYDSAVILDLANAKRNNALKRSQRMVGNLHLSYHAYIYDAGEDDDYQAGVWTDL